MGHGLPDQLAHQSTLALVAAQYVQHLASQGMAESTVKSARGCLNHLEAAAGPILVSAIDAAVVDRMFNMHPDWAQGTKNYYITHLRGFLKYCRRHKHLPYDFDPVEDWKPRKLVKRNKRWLPLDVIADMVVNARPRDRAFMAVAVFTFLRASEIANLRLRDLDFPGNEIAVWRIKTKQEDILPMSVELRLELATWLAHYHRVMGGLEPDWYLIPAQGPHPMKGVPGYRRLVPDPSKHTPLKPYTKLEKPFSIVQRAMRQYGIEPEPGDGCHVLRRSGARNLFEQLRSEGHDGAARRVQSMLGHSSVVITEGYLGIDYEKRLRNQQFSGKPMFYNPDGTPRLATSWAQEPPKELPQ